MHEDEVYQVGNQPLLNGLFGVSKHEWVDSVEIMRVIVNLTPLNAVCRGLDGDISNFSFRVKMCGRSFIFLVCPQVGSRSCVSIGPYPLNSMAISRGGGIPAVQYCQWDSRIRFHWHNICIGLC